MIRDKHLGRKIKEGLGDLVNMFYASSIYNRRETGEAFSE